MTTLMSSQEVERFFEHLHAANPNPKGELYSTNSFTLLIAVVLSAQATDKGVNKATPALFEIADTPQKTLALGEEGLKSYIHTIGLYNSKAKNIIGLCQRLIDAFGSEIPRNREDLESLPGVGRKTANVVLNATFGEAVIAVDTHIFRVANRTGLVHGKTPHDVEKGLHETHPHKIAHPCPPLACAPWALYLQGKKTPFVPLALYGKSAIFLQNQGHIMTLVEWRKTIEKALSHAGFVNASREAKWLLEGVLGKKTLILTPTYSPTEEEKVRLKGWLNWALKGEPLLRIKGVREFWSLPFHINEFTLIPRPETELIVESVLKWIKKQESDK